MFVLGASSLHHALDILNPEKRKAFNEKFYTIPGLSLNNHAKSPQKVAQNLLQKDFAGKTENVIWHDVLNNSLSKHKSNNFRALSVSELLEILESLENKLRALVYWQNVPVFRIESDFRQENKTTRKFCMNRRQYTRDKSLNLN